MATLVSGLNDSQNSGTAALDTDTDRRLNTSESRSNSMMTSENLDTIFHDRGS